MTTAIASLPLSVRPLDFGRSRALERRPVARNLTGDEKPTDVVERAKAGDAAAFREIYATYKRQVSSQLSFLVPRADLEDALQDVFIEVFRSIRRFEGRSQFTTWLYRVAVHVAMKTRRKAGKGKVDVHLVDPPDAPDLGPGPTEHALTQERRARAEALLENLSPKKRTVLVLHDMRGMDASRIAEITGSNILTVRTRLFYARREFEKLAAEDPALSEFFDAPSDTDEKPSPQPSPAGRGGAR